ncbi:CRISPR system precrRNA processing endoribonuclease RAMP protein Cas6 [Sulfurisphaera javensis]|uniref:CRISPR system precrRNA processing endoribonuclease RAMP protein Cas6 n=1 Tax=Sulfurisphaera javensis TaxID=2049879 RepID=A0AAT9GUX6_9CREN
MLLVKATFKIIPTHDTISPVPSSKIMKYLILSNFIFPSLASLVNSRDKNKPLFISFLELSSRKIFNSNDDKSLILKSKTPLLTSVSFKFYEKFHEEIKEGEYKTPYGDFWVFLDKVEMIDISKITEIVERNINKNIRVTMLTPTLLSSKVLLPPSLREKYKINVGYSVLPSVGLLASYAYRTYYSLLGKSNSIENESKAFKLGVLTNALSRVVGYNLKPITVLVGKDNKDRLRKTRGSIGWIEFDILDEKLKKAVAKYLYVSSYLGIGKSRGVGFGEIKVEFVERDKVKKN